MKLVKEILFKLLKQADKIALAVAIISFILSLLWLADSTNLSMTYQEEATNTYFGRVKKYEPIVKDKFSAEKFSKESNLWEKSTKRNNNPKSKDYITDFTDFIEPFKMARSIAKGADNRLIPYKNYLEGICPITGEKLPIPNTSDIQQYTSAYDYDEDGIPDVIEKQLGLNPENPLDAYYDSDNDSFSNITEYIFNKNAVANPEAHPPLIERLVLSEVSNTKIPIEIENIVKNGYNKNNWVIQLNIYTPNKGWRAKFLKIGDNFEVAGIKYKINDIVEKYDTIINPKLGAIEELDNSDVILSDSLGQQIEATVDKDVYEPNRRIVIKDLYTDRNIITKINNTISLGNSKTGTEKYKLISIGDDNKNLVFEDKNSKKYVVGENSNYKKPLNE